jgi:dTDP-4-amino-4,6-dideoxygalactose transaminase
MDAKTMIPSPEARQRQFYALDDLTLSRLVQDVLAEELSVVEGGALERFETQAAALLGGRDAVATCNGTAALHLALFAIELQPGEEVIMPTYAYVGTAVPICMGGARPVFCDIRPDDLTLDLAEVEARITPRTRAILAHQPWGCPAHAAALRALADRYGLALISDSSHAQGATWNGLPHGAYYDLVCASLGKGKLLSGGELGVAVSKDDRHLDRMLLFGHVNRIPQAFRTQEYRHIKNSVGVKYRPHAFALVLALAQLASYRERSRRLVGNIRRFEAELAGIEGFDTFSCPPDAERVYWRVPLRVDPDRIGGLDALVERLRELQFPAQVDRHRSLVHEHSVVTDYYRIQSPEDFPVAHRVTQETLLVHAFPFFDDKVGERALEVLESVSRNG